MAGDVVSAGVSLYIVAEPAYLGVSLTTPVRMLESITVDVVGGSTPAVGTLADVAWKANEHNVGLGVGDLAEAVRSGRMTDGEVDAFLRARGTGILALADGGRAYAIPISFGYETGRAVFAYWQLGPEGEKNDYTDATDRACLTVYDVASEREWRSVVARGPLRELPAEEWADLGGLIDDNAFSPG